MLRITNMRGVDLDVFDFDFDLTWAAVFLSPDGATLGRYGSRVAAGRQLSVEGLRHAMTRAIEQHRRGPSANLGTRKSDLRHVEDYPAAQHLSAKSCIHCHNVYDYRREFRQATGTWKKEEVWVHPEPENVGLVLDPGQGNRIVDVFVLSAAHTAGLEKGDVITKLHGYPVASIADARYALHHAPAKGRILVSWKRDNEQRSAELELRNGWRATDISWRWSLKGVKPAPGLHGEDLSPEEKQRLGLTAKRLAFRQGNFLTTAARQAGLQINDIILGFDGRELDMTAKQFDTFVRLNYQIGDAVTVNFIRGERRMEVTMKLPG